MHSRSIERRNSGFTRGLRHASAIRARNVVVVASSLSSSPSSSSRNQFFIRTEVNFQVEEEKLPERDGVLREKYPGHFSKRELDIV